jgi:uncharacterized protein YjiS (DUF1127 family)
MALKDLSEVPKQWENKMASMSFSHKMHQDAASAFSRLVSRIRYRRQLATLLNLPDYLLKDIGIERHQLSSETRKWFWEE